MKRIELLGVGTALALCAGQAAMAQSVPAGLQLHGSVVDAAQVPVPNADVVVFREGVTVAHVQADSAGHFSFEAPAREYRVLVRAPGFADLRSASVPFKAGGVSVFTLEVAQGGGPMMDVQEGSTPAVRNAPTTGLLQEGPVRQVANTRPMELGAFAAGGLGVTDNRSSFKFFQVGVHAGKVLTPELGTGFLRGNFEYAVDVIPYWGAYTPTIQKVFCNADPGAAPGSYSCSGVFNTGGRYTGVSVTPIILRWNFTHGTRWMPWVQGAGGVVWTNHKFPAVGSTDRTDLASNGIHGDTSVWNFTPQFGLGTHYFVRPRQSLDFSANAVHISSASLGDKNPGVNASVLFSVGYTWWK